MEKKRKIDFKKFVSDHKQECIIALIGIFVAILIIVIGIIYFNSKKEDASAKKDNKLIAITSPGIIKDEEYEGLKFTNTTLIRQNGIYTLSMEVTNTKNEKSTIKQVNIPIKDKKGNELIVLLGYIGKELGPNESATITASASANLSKATDKEITEKK